MRVLGLVVVLGVLGGLPRTDIHHIYFHSFCYGFASRISSSWFVKPLPTQTE